MVIANPPLAEPVIDPGGVTIKPPFEMGVANFDPCIYFSTSDPNLQVQICSVPIHSQSQLVKPMRRASIDLLSLHIQRFGLLPQHLRRPRYPRHDP